MQALLTITIHIDYITSARPMSILRFSNWTAQFQVFCQNTEKNHSMSGYKSGWQSLLKSFKTQTTHISTFKNLAKQLICQPVYSIKIHC
jgi:hypothetical protein